MSEDCSEAWTGAPMDDTRTTGLSWPSARPARGTTVCVPAATTIAVPPGGTWAPPVP